MKSETERWVRRAGDDLQLASLAFERGMEELTLFHCQQALEKLLKGIVVEQRSPDHVRRTHDLVSLVEELHLQISEEEFRLLRRLGELYMPSRYGDEDVNLAEALLVDWLRQTTELFSWLRQLLS